MFQIKLSGDYLVVQVWTDELVLLEQLHDCQNEINRRFYKRIDNKRHGIAGNSSSASMQGNKEGFALDFPKEKNKREELFDILSAYGIEIPEPEQVKFTEGDL